MLPRVASLYKGVVGAASGAGIYIGTYFAFYGAACNLLSRHTDLGAGAVAFVAGGVAAAGGSVVKVPLAVCIRSVQVGRRRPVYGGKPRPETSFSSIQLLLGSLNQQAASCGALWGVVAGTRVLEALMFVSLNAQLLWALMAGMAPYVTCEPCISFLKPVCMNQGSGFALQVRRVS